MASQIPELYGLVVELAGDSRLNAVACVALAEIRSEVESIVLVTDRSIRDERTVDELTGSGIGPHMHLFHLVLGSRSGTEVSERARLEDAAKMAQLEPQDMAAITARRRVIRAARDGGFYAVGLTLIDGHEKLRAAGANLTARDYFHAKDLLRSSLRRRPSVDDE